MRPLIESSRMQTVPDRSGYEEFEVKFEALLLCNASPCAIAALWNGALQS